MKSFIIIFSISFLVGLSLLFSGTVQANNVCACLAPSTMPTIVLPTEQIYPTEEVSPEVTETPTASPTANVTVEPTVVVEGASHGDGLSDGRSDGRSSCPECTKAPNVPKGPPATGRAL